MSIGIMVRAGALAALLACAPARAQAPVSGGPAVADPLAHAQHKATRAHAEWQQAEQARQEAEEAYHRDTAEAAEAQRRYTQSRAAAAAAKRTLEAARSREKAAHAAYDHALNEAHQSPTAVRKN